MYQKLSLLASCLIVEVRREIPKFNLTVNRRKSGISLVDRDGAARQINAESLSATVYSGILAVQF